MVILGLACGALTLFLFGWVERHETLMTRADLEAVERARIDRLAVFRQGDPA
jgi:hypothetical protein